MCQALQSLNYGLSSLPLPSSPTIRRRPSDADGGVEIIFGKSRVHNGVTEVPQAGRLEAAWGRGPAVEEEDVHQASASGRTYFRLYPSFLAWAKSSSAWDFSPLFSRANPRQ